MKKILSFILSLMLLLSIIPVNVITASAETSSTSTINIGDCITLGTYYNEPIVWRCVDIDENGPLMLSDKILSIKAYDAAGADYTYHYDWWNSSIRPKWGSSCWVDSNLRQWLNSDKNIVEWSHCPPTSDKVSEGLNAYADESGFLTNFTQAEKSLIKNVTHIVNVNILESGRTGYCDGGNSDRIARDLSSPVLDCKEYYYKNVIDSVFVLSAYQYNRIYCNNPQYLSAYPTEAAVINSKYKNSSLASDKTWYYWTNIPGGNDYACFEHVNSVNQNGSIANMSAWYDYVGVRPAFYLNVENYSAVHKERPVLSPESASAFIGFVTDNGRLTQSQIENAAWYRIMTNTYNNNDFYAQAQALVLYAVSATDRMSMNSNRNISFLNKELVKFLEKELQGQTGVLQETINDVKNKAAKNVTKCIYDFIDTLLPVSVDNVFSVSEAYTAFSPLLDTKDKAKEIVARIVAAMEASFLVLDSDKAGRYTYFSSYLYNRGNFVSANDESFKALISYNRLAVSDSYWFAKFIDMFSWITKKDSFSNHYELLDEWAEYIYQLSAYLNNVDYIETTANQIIKTEVEYTASLNNTITITQCTTSIRGEVFLPDSFEENPVSTIGTSAFKNCDECIRVKIGNFVEEIQKSAFEDCDLLSEVVIPSSVHKIEDTAFLNCASLKEVYVLGDDIELGEKVFEQCNEDLTIICKCDNFALLDYCKNENISYSVIHSFNNYISDDNSTIYDYGTFSSQCDGCEEVDTVIDCSTTIIEKITFCGASLALQDNICIGFKVKEELFAEIGYEKPYVIFDMNNEKSVVRDYSVVDGKYVFYFSDISPANMNDTIKATLYANYNGTTYASETKEYSVATYCYNTLNKYSADEYANLRTLLVDLLNYGAVSQTYTDYKTDELANANLTEAQKVWATKENPILKSALNKEYEKIDNPTAVCKGATINLKDSITLRFLIEVDNLDAVTVKISGADRQWQIDSSKFEKTDGGYYIYFNNLDAGQLSEKVYLTIYKNDVAISNTICYSVESYAYSKQNDADTKLANLVIALMKYGDSAYRYVNGCSPRDKNLSGNTGVDVEVDVSELFKEL